jgi:hypothetical protein
VEDGRGALLDLVLDVWGVVRECASTRLENLAEGRDRRLCESLLTLHAVADEACAGLGVALDTSDAEACVYRARGRELLARTGSIARIDPRLLRVLPKVRTPPNRAPGVLTLCLHPGPRHLGTPAQDAQPPSWYGPPIRIRHPAAVAVAAARARVGLPAHRGVGAAAGERRLPRPDSGNY